MREKQPGLVAYFVHKVRGVDDHNKSGFAIDQAIEDAEYCQEQSQHVAHAQESPYQRDHDVSDIESGGETGSVWKRGG